MDTAGMLLLGAHGALVALAQAVANPEDRPGFSAFWLVNKLHLSNLDHQGYAARVDIQKGAASAHQSLLVESLYRQATAAMVSLHRHLTQHPTTAGLFFDEPSRQGLSIAFTRDAPNTVGLMVGGWNRLPLRSSHVTMDRFPTTLERAAQALDEAMLTIGPKGMHLLLEAQRAWETHPVQAAASTLRALTVLVAGDQPAELWCLVEPPRS